MPLMPRADRGISLKAAAVWTVACTGLWIGLPVSPRAVLTLPINDKLLGFGPHGEHAIIQRHIVTGDWKWSHSRYQLDIVAVPSGQTIATLPDRIQGVKFRAGAADGHVWLMQCEHDVGSNLLRIDTRLRESDRLPEPLSDILYTWKPVVSSDGQWAVFANPVPHFNAPEGPKGAVLWNLTNNTLHSMIPGLFEPFAFSRDGRWLAGCEFSQPNCIRMIGLETMSTVKSFVGPPEKCARKLQFSPDGRWLVSEFQKRRHPRVFEPEVSLCWNLATGEVMVDEQLVFTQFAAGGKTLVGYDITSAGLEAFHLDSGNRITDSPIRSLQIWADSGIAPDGNTLVTFHAAPDPNFFQSLAERCGLKWPWPAEQRKNSLRMYDAHTFREIERLEFGGMETPGNFLPTQFVHWINDGKLLGIRANGVQNRWHLWDVPPRKSLTWFAGGATLFALLIGFFARQRVRRLRAA